MDSRTLWVLQARAAAYAWYAGHDPPETPRAAREAGLARFEREGDLAGALPASERPRRVEAARKAYYTQLRYRRAAKRLQAHERRAHSAARTKAR